MQSDDEPDKGLQRIVVAIVGALVAFCLVGLGVYYELAHVSVNGWLYSGPTALTAEAGGLFAGGLAAMVALILLLRRR
jgi:hypothetical protein